MKNWYGMAKVRYLGLDRNNCHLQFVAMAINMKRARLLIAAPWAAARGRSPCRIGKRPENERLRTPKMARDEAHTFVAALLRRSKNHTAANSTHSAKRSLCYASAQHGSR